MAAPSCYIEGMSNEPDPNPPRDELPEEEIARRMERGLRRALSTPPQLHGKNPKSPPPKRKERPASKGRVHKGKTRS
jgi:hypothetical protein